MRLHSSNPELEERIRRFSERKGLDRLAVF